MNWSLNEVEGLSRKAARGAGMSWGLAEEAGKSARWLTAAGLPGVDMLAAHLTRNDGMAYDALCPVEVTGPTDAWRSRSGVLCPLIAGAVLCDHASRLVAEGGVALGTTSYPMLLLPFAAGMAELTGSSLIVTWDDTSVCITTTGQIAVTEGKSLEVAEASEITLRTCHDTVTHPRSPVARGDISGDVAQVLNALAHRTYAPDTPESRLAGAGAGLTDND